MSACRDLNEDASGRRARVDWPQLVGQSAEAVARRVAASGQLRPCEVAAIVLATLPAEIAAWLRAYLASRGWLCSDARIPFDILDSPVASPDLCGGRRELVRVAVFGVAGEGMRSDAKRREAIYQQRCAEIMREMRDLESLSYAAARALGHPEVHGNPVLFGMLRAFIAEREAEIRARAHLPGDAGDEEQEQAQAPARKAEFKLPLRERVQAALSKLQFELESHLTAYNEAGARDVVSRLGDLRRRYPGHVEQDVVSRCEERTERMARHRDAFRAQLVDFAHEASEAAERGDQKTSSWIVRRLNAIHTLLPAVLPRERFEELRDEILQSSERQERHEVLHELVAREQAVGAEVKRLGVIVHRYRKLREEGSTEPDVLRQAEEEYRNATAEVRTHDDEWLADLIIELDCLLQDLHGPRARAEAQVDKFVNNVRTVLRQIREEIRIVQKERSASPGGR